MNAVPSKRPALCDEQRAGRHRRARVPPPFRSPPSASRAKSPFHLPNPDFPLRDTADLISRDFRMVDKGGLRLGRILARLPAEERLSGAVVWRKCGDDDWVMELRCRNSIPGLWELCCWFRYVIVKSNTRFSKSCVCFFKHPHCFCGPSS